MNLTELARLTRRYLAEAGTGLYDNADIDSQIRSSARDLAKQLRMFWRTTTLTPDSNGYATLPRDFAGIDRVMADGYGLHEVRNDLPRYGYSAPGWSYDPGDLDNQNRILIHGNARGPLTLRYWAIPEEPTPTQQAWAGRYAEYHDAIALHAAHQLSGGAGPSAARETIWLQRVNQRLEELKGHLVTERLTPRRVQFTTHTHFPSRRRY